MGFVKFLGTAGARFVMIRQLRSSGGVWLNYKNTNLLIDPGPAALLRALRARPKLNPEKLSGVILTHKHIDHSNDVNIIVEAMTEGGFKKRGMLFAPRDCWRKGGVIFDYIKDLPQRGVFLKKGEFQVGDIHFEVPCRLDHQVETYGLKFVFPHLSIGLVSDTAYFKRLADCFRSDILIINVVFREKREEIKHLSLPEAKDIILKVRPKKAILTHFGMTILRAKPHILEENLRKETKLDISFAYDGMKIEF
ncbi:MAG: MBL fold metallo-hydrolase [Candidatus Omnitrophica bacterium]|nr:MBL fold metallo-hydrolase [Candidatus Omnitrophota bacterium]